MRHDPVGRARQTFEPVSCRCEIQMGGDDQMGSLPGPHTKDLCGEGLGAYRRRPCSTEVIAEVRGRAKADWIIKVVFEKHTAGKAKLFQSFKQKSRVCLNSADAAKNLRHP